MLATVAIHRREWQKNFFYMEVIVSQPKIHGAFHACYGPVTAWNPRGVFNCLVRYCLAARRASLPSPLYGRRTGPKLMYSFVLPVEFHRLQSDCSISSGLNACHVWILHTLDWLRGVINTHFNKWYSSLLANTHLNITIFIRYCVTGQNKTVHIGLVPDLPPNGRSATPDYLAACGFQHVSGCGTGCKQSEHGL